MEIAELDVGSSVLSLQNSGWLKCCFTSAETVGLLGTGAQDGHLDFHTAPELSVTVNDNVELNVLGCRVDILGTNCDQCRSMVQCCFTSTETVGLLGTGAQDGHLDFHTVPELCRVLYNNFTFKTCTRVWCESVTANVR